MKNKTKYNEIKYGLIQIIKKYNDLADKDYNTILSFYNDAINYCDGISVDGNSLYEIASKSLLNKALDAANLYKDSLEGKREVPNLITGVIPGSNDYSKAIDRFSNQIFNVIDFADYIVSEDNVYLYNWDPKKCPTFQYLIDNCNDTNDVLERVGQLAEYLYGVNYLYNGSDEEYNFKIRSNTNLDAIKKQSIDMLIDICRGITEIIGDKMVGYEGNGSFVSDDCNGGKMIAILDNLDYINQKENK